MDILQSIASFSFTTKEIFIKNDLKKQTKILPIPKIIN